jgi:hypothetical protein
LQFVEQVQSRWDYRRATVRSNAPTAATLLRA